MPKRRFHGRFWLCTMSGRVEGPYDGIARKWLALAERRQQHLLELCDTGRWRHYYTETEFLDEMRKVLRVRAQWATIAGLPQSDDLSVATDQPSLDGELLNSLTAIDRAAERGEHRLRPAEPAITGLPTARWPD
jgi:uncharacterized repeat protein (TIGR03809 family)